MRHPDAVAAASEERIRERLALVDAAPAFVWRLKLRVEFPGEGPRWLRRTCKSYEDAVKLRARELASGKFDMAWLERAWSKAKPQKPRKARRGSVSSDGVETYGILGV